MTWKRGHTVNLVQEEHHRIYGSGWALGLDQHDYLLRLGLQPDHPLLDFGCGAGRAGIHLIDYLLPRRYVGVDGHEPSLRAFANYEIPLNRLSSKQPSLHQVDLVQQPLNIESQFQFVMAFSVFNHMQSHVIAGRSVVRALRPGGLLVCAFGVPANATALGLQPVRAERTQSRLVPEKTIDWYVFAKPTSGDVPKRTTPDADPASKD